MKKKTKRPRPQQKRIRERGLHGARRKRERLEQLKEAHRRAQLHAAFLLATERKMTNDRKR